MSVNGSKSTRQWWPKWYASGGGIARTGPYRTAREAWDSVRLTPEARRRQRIARGPDSPYPVDASIWPEWRSRSR